MKTLLTLCLALTLAACSGDSVTIAPSTPLEEPEGPTGPGAAPSISGVSPLSIFMEREADVLISGSGTSWDASSTVDFGAGISVTSKVVASPSAILATVRSDSTTLGTTDIVVTDAVGSTTFANTFRIAAPLELTDVVGTFMPGAQVRLRARQLDEETPFPVLEHLVDVYFAETGQRGLLISLHDSVFIAGYVFPLNEPPGPRTLAVRSSLSGETVTSRIGAPRDLPGPSVSTLPLSTPTNVQIEEELGTRVFRIDAPAGSFVEVSTSNVVPTPTLPPNQLLISPDSSFSMGTFESFLAADGSPWFVAVTAPQNGPYTLDITANVSTPIITPVVGASVAGNIAVSGESDFYSIDLTAGQTVEIAVADGAVDTCATTIQAAAELLAPDGTVLWIDGLGCPSSSVGPVEVAGTYYVRVWAGANPFTFDYVLELKVS